jgi:cobalt/nickel transport system ATP-binding protein
MNYGKKPKNQRNSRDATEVWMGKDNNWREEPILNITDVSAGYEKGADVLFDINFTLSRGESVALIGANGSGKSSLLLTIAGVLKPSKGHIAVGGLTINKKTSFAIHNMVGLVFQNPDDQLFMPTVKDDITFGPRNYGFDAEEAERKTDAVLDALGIAALKDRTSTRLSGGEKRLVAIATALVMQPSIILFDEPSSFLDPKSRRGLIDTLNQIDTAKIIATHDYDLAARLCTRAVIMERGKITLDGAANNILRDETLLETRGL